MRTPIKRRDIHPGEGGGGVVLREQTQRRSQTNTATAAHTTRSRILPQLRFVLALTLSHYYCDVKQSHNTRPHDYGHCCIYYSISYTTKAYHYLFCCSRQEISRAVCYLADTTDGGRRMESYTGWMKKDTGVNRFVYGGGYDLSR